MTARLLYLIISAWCFCSGAGFAQDTTAASKSPLTNAAAAGGSFLPSLSGDGSRVVFVSYANDLTTNDNGNDSLDIFVHNLTTGETELVSVDSSGFGGGDDNSNYPTISSNGQFIAFASEASNLVPNDTNGVSDIFVRDVVNRTTRLVSSPVNGATRPVMTPDGRYVAFETVGWPGNIPRKVFFRDLQAEASQLISIGPLNPTGTGGDSHSPAISDDGRRVAFISTITNLVPNVTNLFGDIYVRDLYSMETFWVSSNAAWYPPRPVFGPLPSPPRRPTWYRASSPVISADGAVVAFKTSLPPSIPAAVFRHNLFMETTTFLTDTSFVHTAFDMSADGRYVAYDVLGSRTNIVTVWDSIADTNLLVSVPISGALNFPSFARSPIISRNGKHVAFLSNATNLVEGARSTNLNIYARDLEAQVTRLVSVNRDDAPSSVPPDIAPSLSADGSLIAFDSLASDLVDGDFNLASDVFVRDLNAGITRLISRPHPSLARPTAARHSKLPKYPGCVSSNGNIVAFMSSDNNLSMNDTNEHIDSFAANLSTGAIFPVSATMTVSNRAGRFPIVSASGEYLIFYSQQPAVQIGTFDSIGPSWVFRFNLAQGAVEQVDTQPTGSFVPPFPSQERWNLPSISPDGNLVAYTVGNSANMQLFLRDMAAGTNQLISVSLSGQPSGYSSFNPILGSDSRWVVFESQAIDLVTNSTVGAEISLYARDLLSNTTTLISQDAFGNALQGKATSAVFVASSRYLTFQHASPNVFALMGYLYDLQTQQPPQMICSNCSSLSLSADARTLAFSRRRSGAFAFDIWEKDLQTGQERLVSLNRTGTARANRSSSSPHISADGRFIVFQSEAGDLVLNDHNRVADVFVRDRATGVTMLLSRSQHGTGSADGGASNPIMAADGRSVVFHSNAGDLVEGDFNSAYDIFVLRLGAGDSDGDGLDDTWELAHFNDLSRDGRGDDDSDGLTDLQEFLAGTSPRSGESVLTVLSLTAFGSGETTLLWSAVPGRTYQVQFKSAITNPGWTDLPGPVTAADTTASYTDPVPATERFYRVVLVQ